MDPRHWLLVQLFQLSEKPYAWLKSCEPWGLSAEALQRLPEGTLGRVMGLYLASKGFELLPKLERHDFYHLLTDTPTDVPHEVALQYLMLGNGKRSPYLFAVILLGTLVLPEQARLFLASYRRGAALRSFHELDFRALLTAPYAEVRAMAGPRPPEFGGTLASAR
jgi:ubiquinone biosynthesis protein Coq4